MTIEPLLLSDWLSWAGSKLISMPSDRIKPSFPRACWPDYETEVFQLLQFRSRPKIRMPAPSKEEIPIMEVILLFPNYCLSVDRRRVLHLRLLTNPFTMNPINSWNHIAKSIDTSVPKVKRLHNAGLTEAALKIPETSIKMVSDFFSDLPMLALRSYR